MSATTHDVAPAATPSDRILDAEGLAALIPGRSARTILCDIHRRPNTLPPPLRLPGHRRPLWLESDVLRWVRSFAVYPDQLDPARPKRGRGRPSKREQAEATRLGITVTELRKKRDAAAAARAAGGAA